MRVDAHILALAVFVAGRALAADPAPQSPAQPSPTQGAASANEVPEGTELAEVVVNGVPYSETVLPTRMKSSSVYGIDLNVMDTPRNTTLLSTTQLDTLDIKDPRAFSYLTASSYTDSAFGGPNVPRIRGQYGDVFYNGMRSSFTNQGYGGPLSFNSIDTLDIVKGPASVVDGPGPGVGGEVDLITKRPNMLKLTAFADGTVDSLEHRRITVDVGGPVVDRTLGVRLSYSGDDSGSYFHGLYFHQNSLYAAVRWEPSDRYRADFNTEITNSDYTENVGINRINQGLIDNGQYLTGAPNGELLSSLYGTPPFQTGSPGNPYSPVVPFLATVQLGNPTPINLRTTVDATPGTSARAFSYTAQLIQHLQLSENSSLENNTFLNYENRDNQDLYYFADSANGISVENRTSFVTHFDLGTIGNDAIFGATFRYSYMNYIENFNNEPTQIYDLTSNPSLWVFSPSYQALGNAVTYTSANGRTQYGVPGRDATNFGATGDSKVKDGAVFFQNRMTFTPEFSLLYGARMDAAQASTHDPLGGAVFNGLPQDHTTAVFGLVNTNLSAVYKIRPWVNGYVTYDFTQSLNPNGGDGGINAYGQVPDHVLMRQASYLYETGLKFNLFNEKLFIGTALFDQKRVVPVGNAGTSSSEANIRGIEIESNYQPSRSLFATASYSYLKTTLNQPAPFYDYPAQPGVNINGAGVFAVFQPGQTFNDPGIPQHVFNFLGSYQFGNGLGLRTGLLVTGPIETTTSGQLNLTQSLFVPQNIVDNGGYYRSPVIPWQYTLNAAAFYHVSRYTVTLSVYNLTDRLNWQSSYNYEGNDFLVRTNPRSVELRVKAAL